MLKKMVNKYQHLPVQVKASLWFLICGFLQRGISTLTTPVFTRLLSTSEYGQYNVFNSWLSIITVFVTLNLCSGVYTQGLVKFEEERDIYSSSLQGLTLTLVLIWTVIYLSFYKFWNEVFSLTTVQVLAMLLMIWLSSAFNFWAREQRVDFKYQKLIIITILVSLAKPILGIILVVLADDKVTARILGIALVEVIGYIGLFMSQMLKGKKFYSRKYWKYALKFNVPLVPHYLSMSVLSGADRIMIERMVGTDEAGIYSLAYSVSLIMTIFNTALVQTIEPWIYKKIKTQEVKDISKIAYPAFIFIAVMNAMLMLFAPEIIAIFAPSSYYEAIWIVPPVAMGVYFMFAYNLFAEFEFYYEKTNYIAVATVLGAVANIVLNIIFINIFGYIAAGYTTLVCYILYAIFHYSFMRKICAKKLNNIQPYSTKIILLITLMFMAIGFFILFLYNNYIVRYLFIIISIIVLIINRKVIIEYIQTLVSIKKEKKK